MDSRTDVFKVSEKSVRRRISKDRLFFIAVCLFSFLAAIPLFAIILEVAVKGLPQFNLSFFTETSPTTLDAMLAKASGRRIPGGVLNGITGTLIMVFIAALIAVPAGIFCGVFLAENPHRKISGVIRTLADMIQGIPSIVLGMVAYAWVVVPLGSYSAFAGAISLAIMMMPLIIRSTEETMKMLPGSLKEAALALGAPYRSVVLKVLLPSASGGLFTGILLAVSRVMGETAPLMLTALGSTMVNWDVFKPASSLPLLVWEFYNDPNLVAMIWSTSLLLLVITLALNIVAKIVAEKRRIN